MRPKQTLGHFDSVQGLALCTLHSRSRRTYHIMHQQKRNMLRLTAKATQFGKKTFTSWLIESAGTVPIKRRKDYSDGVADNSNVMQYLMEVSISISYIPQ